MITLRPANERGRTSIGWLESQHSFSFGDYHDRRHMGFRSLRVINDDWISPGMGFGTHPHRDMEIITVVQEGSLEHRDSLGTGSVIKPGEVQRMSAGTGILHSEFNGSVSEPVHLLQIWVLPRAKGLEPSYEQQTFAPAELQGQLKLVASPDGRAGSLTVQQDVALYQAKLATGERVGHRLAPGRAAWIQIGSGAITLNGQRLSAGDGAAVENEEALEFVGLEPAEFLLFDLA
jgi:redox-sensitive bicupin YhaK (pirin superfamily)